MVKNKLLWGVFALTVLAGLLLFFYSYPEDLRLYGGEEGLALILQSGTLADLFADQITEKVQRVIVRGVDDNSLIISRENFHRFEISRRGRRWRLYLAETKEKLLRVNEIFLETPAAGFGVYHLSNTEEIFFYSLYDTLENMFESEESAKEFYQSGNLAIPDDIFRIGVSADSVLFVFSNGEVVWEQPSMKGLVHIAREQVLPVKNSSTEQKILKAVWEFPPSMSALDVYNILKSSLAGEQTMAIFIDGLGYKLWQYAEKRGYTETFPVDVVSPMRVVFPPRTVYNYYAFGTGNLLRDRHSREKNIFDTFLSPRQKGLIIEGEMQVFSSPLEQNLHARNRSGSGVDEAIFRSALSAAGDYDFIFVHFHDIDELGHRHGPYSPEVMEAIKRTGSYISELRTSFSGRLFIFSDHGMHTSFDEEEGLYRGTHYTAKAEDIIGIFREISGELSYE